MKNLLKWAAIIFIGFIIIGVIFGDNSSQNEVNLDESSPKQLVVADSSQTEANVDVNPSEQLVVADTDVPDIAQEEAKPEGLSRPQKNAVRSAEQYLDMTGFSCDGLIEQLSSSAGSKYTVSEANYGAQQAGACS